MAYSGTNEYGVVQAVVSRLREGMEDGTLVPPGSAALGLAFLGAGDSVSVANAGPSVVVASARGTEQQAVEEEEGYLSRYGTMFVCFVAVLGAGTVAATYARYRKRQRRKKGDVAVAGEAANYPCTDYDSSLDRLGEDVARADDPDEESPGRGCEPPPPGDPPAGKASSADSASADGLAAHDPPASDPSGFLSRLDVNVSPGNRPAGGDDEIEVNLPRDHAPTFNGGWWSRIPTYPMSRN